MKKIAITSDVNAGLDYIGYDSKIPVLRSMINFGDEHFIDGIDITADEFYDKVEKSSLIPSTSAPTLGEAIDMIENLIKEGYTDVIHFPISFELSGTGKTVLNLTEQYKDKIKIHVFDTKTACHMQAYLALEAKRLVEEGKDVDYILDYVKKLRDNSNAYFLVDDLKYLIKNGRLTGAKGYLGLLLKIKPILILNKKGQITTHLTVRTHKAAVTKMVDIVKNELKDARKVKIMLFHTKREKDAYNLKEELEKIYPNSCNVYIVTPAVGAHIGCGILGIGYFILDNID